MIYFDNAGTTKALPEVAEKITEMMLDNFGNPSSISKLGLLAEKEIRKTAQSIAKVIGAKEEEIIFTSGGTESDNMAIVGVQKAYKRNGNHIITTSIEHPAIKNPLKELEKDNVETTYLSVDEKGYISIDELKSSIKDDTILVSIIFVNNEVGTIQNIEEIGKVIKDINPKTLFHVDAVQGFCKHKISVTKMKIDLLSFSGHKVHSSKGVGGLYIRKGINLPALILGGGQQKGLRGGTENSCGIAGLGVAVETAFSKIDSNLENVKKIKEHIAKGVLSLGDVNINGDFELGSPYVLNVTFLGLRSEVLLHSLEEKGIYVSAGSACDSRKHIGSPILQAMGLKENQVVGAIRFSFCAYNTLEEAEKTIEILKEVVPFLRKYNR